MAAEKKNKNAAKLPTKQVVNFAHMGEEKINWLVAVPAVILIIVLAVLFSKFGVADRLQKLSEKRQEAARAESYQQGLYEKINAYGNIKTEYAHYSYDGFTSDELGYVDRGDVFTLLEEKIMSVSAVSSFSLSGNVLVLNISSITLDEVSQLSQDLKEDPLVSFCMVSTAQTYNEEAMEDDRQDVSAVMTVYLTKPVETTSTKEDGGDES